MHRFKVDWHIQKAHNIPIDRDANRQCNLLVVTHWLF